MKRIFNLTDASGKLARSRLRLLEASFDVLNIDGIKIQAADTLSRLETSDTDSTDFDCDIPGMMVYLIEQGGRKINDNHYGISYLICYCQQCDETAETVNRALLEVAALSPLRQCIWRLKKFQPWQSFYEPCLHFVNAKLQPTLSDSPPY